MVYNHVKVRDSMMSATSGDSPVRQRRRRTDAERNRSVILQAAAEVLNAQPDAGMEDIARAAGVSRQTIYAHFPSRDVLLDAVIERATADVMAAFGAAALTDLPPAEALTRLLEEGWAAMARYPFAWHLPPVSAEADRDRHAPVLDLLREVIRRGQDSGDFNRELPADWLLAALLALGRTAEEQVRGGQLTVEEASTAMRVSFLRLLGLS